MSHFSERKKKSGWDFRRKVIALVAILLAIFFVVSLSSQIFIYALAVDQEDIQALQNQQSALDEQSADIQKELDALAGHEATADQEYQLLNEQYLLLSSQVENTQAQVEEYDAKIAETQASLQEAKDKKEDYYDLTCKRVRQMEEGGAVSLWQVLLSSNSMSELLSNMEIVAAILRYDQDNLDLLADTQQEIEDDEAALQEEQAEQKALLTDLKSQQTEMADNVAAAEKALQEIIDNRDLYSAKLTALDQERHDLDEDILEAETAYAIQQAEERARAEEEARKAKEEAARKAAEEKAAKDAEKQKEQETPKEEKKEEDSEPPRANSKPDDSFERYSGSPTGAAVVKYAMRFVGNPYVWGGTSLTKGADCSGFVQSVYAYFGYALPHSSLYQRSCGISVSYEEAQAGDLICYDGHVGIYIGSGQMVNAYNAQRGIIVSSVNLNRLLAVRRIIF